MEGTVIQQRFHLRRKVGEGANWVVFEGEDLETRQRVAVKIMKQDATGPEDVSDRLLRQLEETHALQHPSVARLLHVGYDGGMRFLVQEYVEGKNLRQWFMEEGRSFQDLREKLHMVLRALATAHEKGILHRGLKPENIIITPSHEVKLTDFALAWRLEGQTQTSTPAGHGHSVFYITPEQAKGQRGDARSDLYSLGVLLYELVTGKLPFWAADPVRVISKHIHETPVRPRKVNPRVPQWLEAIIMKLLEKEPESRYQSAANVLADLEKAAPHLDDAVIALDTWAGARKVLHYAPLVGRETEERLLRELLARAYSNGVGCLVLMEGESGIGKSRIVHEVGTLARLHGMAFLHGHADAQGFPVFRPFIGALREFLRKTGSGLKDILGADEARPLEGLVDATAGEPGGPAVEPLEHYLQQLVATYQAIAARYTLFLLIEDLSMLDSPSVALLDRLVPLLEKMRMVLVVTCRTGALVANSPTAQAAERWRSFAHTARIVLQGLSASATGELARHLLVGPDARHLLVPSDFPFALHRSTGGNPLKIEELLQILLRDRVVKVVDRAQVVAQLSHFPPSCMLEQLFAERIRGLPEKVTQTLAVAACIGRSVDYEILNRVAGLDEDELVSILTWAGRAGFIEPEWFHGIERFRFRHRAMHRFMAEALEARRRQRLHLLVAVGLEEVFADRLPLYYESLETHFAESSQWRKAAEYAYRRGERLMHFLVYGDAAAAFERAIQLLDTARGTDDLRLLCLKRLIQAWRLLDRPDLAGVAASQALDVARKLGDQAELAELEVLASGLQPARRTRTRKSTSSSGSSRRRPKAST